MGWWFVSPYNSPCSFAYARDPTLRALTVALQRLPQHMASPQMVPRHQNSQTALFCILKPCSDSIGESKLGRSRVDTQSQTSHICVTWICTRCDDLLTIAFAIAGKLIAEQAPIDCQVESLVLHGCMSGLVVCLTLQ